MSRQPTLTFSFPEMNPDQRLRELILYIAYKCERDPRFGATKLNKILAFADFSSYFQRSTPITGAEYMRLPKGPVPKRIKPLTAEMERNHELKIRVVSEGTVQQKRVIPLRDPDLSIFSAAEIAFVDRVIDSLWGRTARAVSDYSHQIAWKVAHDRESIPYEAVFLSDEKITAYDIVRTAELAEQFGWERE